MFRLIVALIVALALPRGQAAEAEKKAPALTTEIVAAPTARDASGASLTTGPDGTAWLSWIESAGANEHALLFATYDAAAKKWSTPRPIARGRDWLVNWADFPSLAVGPDGHVTAVWYLRSRPAAAAASTHVHEEIASRAVYSRSTDRGQTWSVPVPVVSGSFAVEFVSIVTLADGRVLAAWLDGRARQAGQDVQQLYARVLGASGPDTLVDASVCDCCPTTLTAFPDGTALLAYRGRTKDEVRDIRVARFDGRAWSEPRPLNNDDWRIAGCPVNGPQLASDGGRVAAAWFTGADNDPRVLATFSGEAGERFLMPLRLDTAKPLGRVDALLLRDSAMLVTWVGADGSVWLRRVSPEYSTSAAVELAPRGNGGMKTVPRAAVVRDYAGGTAAAQVMVAFVRDNTLRTVLVSVPEGELLEAEKNCDCAPTADELRGFPMRGTIVEALAATGSIRIRHPQIPGIFAAGAHEFAVAPELLPRLPPGRQFLGRIEQRAGRWWLFDIRLLAAPAK